ncbi:MAG: hypothetical protein JWP87_4184 [Labilithrix sp.]|nr:hypothetical protein [Labilithrix sp.]
MALAATLSACKGRRDPAPDGDGQAPAPDGDGQAPGAELPPAALMTYGSGGGATGRFSQMTVFADGRVEGTERGRPTPPVRVPFTRVEKLAADLASTGVFAQKDGTWEPSRPVPDGGGAHLIVRDKAGSVHAFSWGAGATAPAAVERALQVGGAFASEVERQHPRTPCACQAGDPLCSCL